MLTRLLYWIVPNIEEKMLPVYLEAQVQVLPMYTLGASVVRINYECTHYYYLYYYVYLVSIPVYCCLLWLSVVTFLSLCKTGISFIVATQLLIMFKLFREL